MEHTFPSDTSFNSIVWIRSLRTDEMGPSNRMVEDMDVLCSIHNCPFECHDVSSAQELHDLLGGLAARANTHGQRPILNFDMHGNKDSGLCVCNGERNEFVSWESLGAMLQRINIATGNNLIVIGAACYSLAAIKSMSISSPVPFYVLLAPEGLIFLDDIEDRIPSFFRSVFETGDLRNAIKQSLSDKFVYFHCEKIFFIVLFRYIKGNCIGKSAKERREKLLTEVFLSGVSRTDENIKMARSKIKEGIRPNQELIDHYAESFLIGRKCSFNIDHLLDFVSAD